MGGTDSKPVGGYDPAASLGISGLRSGDVTGDGKSEPRNKPKGGNATGAGGSGGSAAVHDKPSGSDDSAPSQATGSATAASATAMPSGAVSQHSRIAQATGETERHAARDEGSFLLVNGGYVFGLLELELPAPSSYARG